MPFAFSRFRAALFDIDGTLMDSTEQCIRGLSDTFFHFGGVRPSDAAIMATVGTPLTVQLKMFGLGECSEEVLNERIAFALGRYEAYEHLVREHVGAVQTLELARRGGKKTGLVTSKNAAEVSRFQTLFRGWEFVEAIVCASDVANPKPHPESLQLICKKLEVAPQDAVFIGDSLFDLRCARDAGVPFVAVSYGATPKDRLAAERPELLFETPEELRAWAAEDNLMTYAKKENATCTT